MCVHFSNDRDVCENISFFSALDLLKAFLDTEITNQLLRETFFPVGLPGKSENCKCAAHIWKAYIGLGGDRNLTSPHINKLHCSFMKPETQISIFFID